MKKLSKQQKGYIGIVAVLLAVILALGITLGVATKWGKDTENLKPNKEEAYTGMLMPGEEETNGISLVSTVIPKEQYADYGIALTSAEPETAYTVTAVVEPAEATDTVSWSVQWKNASSSWASGKTVTSYVTVRSSGDRTATVECKQAFGEVVQLKVTASSNGSVSATKDINYLKRPTFDFYPTKSGSGGNGTLTVGKTGSSASYLYCTAEYGVGTVQGNFTVPTATVEFSDQYCLGALRTYISQAQAVVTSGVTISTAKSKTFTDPTNRSNAIALKWSDFFTATGAGLTSIGTQAENFLKSGIVYMANNGAPGYGKVKATVIYTYGDFQLEYEKEADITKFDVESLSVGITGLSFSDNGSLTF